MAFWSIGHILNKIFDSATSALGVKVTGSIPAGTNNIGDVDIASINGAAQAISGATGAAVPAGAMAQGITNGTNLQMERQVTASSAAVSEVGVGATGVILYAGGSDFRNMVSASAVGDGGSLANSQLVGLAGFNTTWDRWRNNTSGTLLASAARTANTTTAVQTNYNAEGVLLHLDVTANPGGAETLQVYLYADNPVGSNDRQLVAFPATAAAANAAYLYICFPNATETIATANLEVQGLPLPRTWYVQVVHSSTGSWTYSLGYDLVV